MRMTRQFKRDRFMLAVIRKLLIAFAPVLPVLAMCCCSASPAVSRPSVSSTASNDGALGEFGGLARASSLAISAPGDKSTMPIEPWSRKPALKRELSDEEVSAVLPLLAQHIIQSSSSGTMYKVPPESSGLPKNKIFVDIPFRFGLYFAQKLNAQLRDSNGEVIAEWILWEYRDYAKVMRSFDESVPFPDGVAVQSNKLEMYGLSVVLFPGGAIADDVEPLAVIPVFPYRASNE